MRRARLAGVVAAATLAGFSCGTAHAATGLPILGFQSEDSPTQLIAADAPALGSVGVDGVNLAARPGTVSAPSPDARRQLAAAHRAGRPAVLLVGNFSDRIDDFSEPLARRTLRSPAATATAARALVSDVRSQGWDGISVDLESLAPRDQAGLVAFLGDLRAGLGPERSLTVCVELATSAAGYRAMGYDLPRFAPIVSEVVLMAYDEHGPWESAPGPVGATPWVRAGLRAMLALMPGDEVDLGVAGYGYVWGPGSHRAQLSDAGARRLVRRARATARWVPAAQEWTAHLRDGATVWWSDRRTLAARESLAASLGLHGLAVWSLGLSDRLR